MIDRAMRKVGRERTKLGSQEKKYLTEIKALAKANKHVTNNLSFPRQQLKF
jgi:hypothetical protein